MPFDPARVYARHPMRPWWVMGGLAVALLVLTGLVALEWGPLMTLDADIAREAHNLGIGHETWVDGWEVVARVPGPSVLRVALLALAVLLALRGWLRPAVFLVALVAVEWVVAPASKHLLDRARPEWDNSLTQVSGLSFPSGHAFAGGMFTAAAVLLTIAWLQRGPVRRLVCLAWVVVGVLACANRVFLGVHFTTDVVAGFLAGCLLAVAVWQVVMVVGVTAPAPVTTTVGPAPSRFAVVLNPIRVADRVAFEAVVEQAALRHGWQSPLWLETRVDDPGVGMTEQALAAGVDMVIAAGGDGTVRVVCSELARTGVPVGVVPLGTGNLLARNLGIPLYPPDAVEVALAGQDRAIDVVDVAGDELEPTAFTVMSGIGFDAAIMAGAPDDLKKRMGWSAYVVSAVRQLRYPAAWMTIEVDDREPVRTRARTVVIGNVGSLQARIPLLPDARPDDGVLDVVVIAPRRTLGWLSLLLRVLGRRRRTDARLDRMTGRSAVVRSEKPLPRQLDGDPVGEGTEISATVSAGTLLVRVPR